MKKYITIQTINNTPVEPFLKKTIRQFVFHREHFKNCKTDEEILEMFCENCSPDIRFDEVIILDEPNYKKGFDILMEYWDSLPDEEKDDIDKRLKRCGI